MTTELVEVAAPKSESRKSPSMLPYLLGTWTLETHVSSDLGYYKANAFVVMHVMADPLAATYSCSLPDCDELQNQICQRNLDACVDTASSISQWSDVSVFYQFGFDVLSGTYPWRTHVIQNTSDWLGPYPLVLSQKNFHLQSRYVTTLSTDYLQPPVNYTLTSAALFDQYAGATAVHNSIAQQTKLHPPAYEDPYAAQLETCAHGDIHPILPRLGLQLQHSTKKNKKNKSNWIFDMEFSLLSLPEKDTKDSLYKVWPTVQKHFPDLVAGPYCFQGDPHRAYALNVSLGGGANTNDDGTAGNNNPWKLTAGCVNDLPCWPTDPHPPKPPTPTPDGPSSTADMIWMALTTYGVYFLLVFLIISLTVNCQFSYQLQRLREQQQHQHPVDESSGGRRISGSRQRQQRRRQVHDQEEGGDLQEPLLSSSAAATEEEDPTTTTTTTTDHQDSSSSSAPPSSAAADGAVVVVETSSTDDATTGVVVGGDQQTSSTTTASTGTSSTAKEEV